MKNNNLIVWFLKRLFIAVFLISFFIFPAVALADDQPPWSTPLFSDIFQKLGETAGPRGAGLTSQDIRITTVLVIRVLLHFIGLLFLILIIYGGILWMTSAGNEEQVGKAKKVLISSIIGVAIILISLIIVNFVLINLYEYALRPSGAYTTPIF